MSRRALFKSDQDTFAGDSYADQSGDGAYDQNYYDNSQYDEGNYDHSSYDQSYNDQYNNGQYDTGSQYDNSYSDNSYNVAQDTGDAMMAYNENAGYSDQPGVPSDYDPDYDEGDDYGGQQHDDGYYEEDPMYDPDMPQDYYGDYPEDEWDDEDEERQRKARKRRAGFCCLIMLCCLLILIILVVIFLLSLREEKNAPTEAPTFSPYVDDTDDDFFFDDIITVAPGVVTSQMDPYNYICPVDYKRAFPHVFDQCSCDDVISKVPEDVKVMRDLLMERLWGTMYPEQNYAPDWTSCDTSNLALLWLASGDNRDSGEIRQRYTLAKTFFTLNGTIWDYTDGWLSDLNECLWLGVQCNNKAAVNSLAVDTNNLFGLVRVELFEAESIESTQQFKS